MLIKFENLCEIDKFLEIHNLPKLRQEIENLTSPTTQNILNIQLKTFSQRKF